MTPKEWYDVMVSRCRGKEPWFSNRTIAADVIEEIQNEAYERCAVLKLPHPLSYNRTDIMIGNMRDVVDSYRAEIRKLKIGASR